MNDLKFTSDGVKTLIAQSHNPAVGVRPEWAVFFELSNGTGYGRDQAVDVFAMHCWASKKHRRVAYEVKVSRGDFLRELQQPAKREWAMGISNEFFFVAPSGVVHAGELPEGCGLKEVSSTGKVLRTMRAAPWREAREFTTNEVAALVRAAQNTKFFEGILWRHSGRDLSEEDLRSLLASIRTAAERDEIERRVKEGVENQLMELRSTLATYATELKGAGIEPPDWMESQFFTGSYWSAKRWVEKNIAPGPAGTEIKHARESLESAAEAVERAAKSISRLARDPIPAEVAS